MKNYEEIRQDIESVKDTRKAIENYIYELDAKRDELLGDGPRFRARKNLSPEKVAQLEELSKAIKTATHDIKCNDIHLVILRQNAEISLGAEMLPIALDLLSKYKGKRYGEVTEKKISDEMYDRTGYHMRLDGEHRRIRLYSWNHRPNLTFDLPYKLGDDVNVLIDNKVQCVPAESFKMPYVGEYVEDSAQRVLDIVAKREEVEETLSKAQEAIEAYNALIHGMSMDVCGYEPLKPIIF